MAANRVTHENLISDELAEHILGSATAIETEAPAAAFSVVRLLCDARAEASDDELAGEAAAVEQFLAVIHARPARGERGAQARWQRRAAAIVAASAVMFGGFGVAAAANGSLPDPLQRLAHTSLGHVGLDVPSPDVVPTTTGSDHGKTVSSVAKESVLGGPEKGAGVCATASRKRCRSEHPTTSLEGDSTTAPDSPTGGDHGKGTPATPATPAKPATPATPATPAKPATPATPATPAKPATPATPAKPATPATPAESQAPTSLPAQANARSSTPDPSAGAPMPSGRS
jgi:hypothetical protein